MTHPPSPLEQAFARLRTSAQADAAACAHMPAAVEAMVLALLLRLLGQLERLARTWHAGAAMAPASQSPALRPASCPRAPSARSDSWIGGCA